MGVTVGDGIGVAVGTGVGVGVIVGVGVGVTVGVGVAVGFGVAVGVGRGVAVGVGAGVEPFTVIWRFCNVALVLPGPALKPNDVEAPAASEAFHEAGVTRYLRAVPFASTPFQIEEIVEG
jgi:hypothetical protein